MTDPTQNPSIQSQISELEDTITNIDSFSQTGFSQISAIASLILCRLESGLQHSWQLDEIYQAVRTIRSQAQDFQNSINGEAEHVGCNYRRSGKITIQNQSMEARP